MAADQAGAIRKARLRSNGTRHLFRQSPPKFSELMSDFGRTVERYAEAIHLYASVPTSLPFAHPCNRFEVCSSSQHSSCLSSIVCCIDQLNPQAKPGQEAA